MLTREAIQEAITCVDWQRIRIGLKGTTTGHKLRLLKRYLEDASAFEQNCCNDKRRWIQVYNYLNALSRGGQISPVVEGDLEGGKVHIRR